MKSKIHSKIFIKGARTNNLKDITLEIPHNKFIVVTGVSGSGKSSLASEVIAKEGQRRYFETMPSFARQFIGKINRPDADEIEGLSPVIAIGQQTTGMHARSTVGTMSDIYDLLRLLYARSGSSPYDIKLSRALFSFNSELGKCKSCNGIGKQEKIDLGKLILHPEKSIREGALAPTLPNGYIMYSQVTIDVLNQVCLAEGFNVDIPWVELTPTQRNVILYGSDKIKVPFGKHSLESRLKWTGIKAKPREEGHYKGMIPIMSDILKRDRNANILRYVKSIPCDTCKGARLNEEALSVRVQKKSISEIVCLELNAFRAWLIDHKWDAIGEEIINRIVSQIDLLDDLGLGHLTLDRSAKTLRGTEIQRIRIANQILVPLSDVLYVFDEPSIGLHPEENQRLIYHLKQLTKRGNTIIVVEHDLNTIRSADHIIEIGPGAGIDGGEVVYNGSFLEFFKDKKLKEISPTYRALTKVTAERLSSTAEAGKSIHLNGCYERNLKSIDVQFKIGKLNIVSGRSGSGKSSLVKETLQKMIEAFLGKEIGDPVKTTGQKNLDLIDKLIFIDHTPIGRTPRSNPATYLGISDHIRDIFASISESKKKGFTKSKFSFNNKGGRCETCQGAGKTQIGMHFLGKVDLVCGICNGDRFNEEVLEIKYKSASIADCYRMSVDEAVSFFNEDKKVLKGLLILQEIGLGYLKIGQSSTTLSGGEAQRIKITNELQRKDSGRTLYIILEPTIGLHDSDTNSLLLLFDRIRKSGNTIVCIDQNQSVIQWSDWHIELGPLGGSEGGMVMYQGVPQVLLQENNQRDILSSDDTGGHSEIVLRGVSTHGLKNVDVRFPKNQLTVVTGVSGSGKSSLVYDTLFAESNARFTESLSTYNRSFLKQNNQAKIMSHIGLGPAIAINRKRGSYSSRSTVGTLSGIYTALRLLYSRIANQQGATLTAQHFSFNHHLGACTECKGLGLIKECDSRKVIVAPQRPILNWEVKNKALQYYMDSNGQFMAALKEVSEQKKYDINLPWEELEGEVKDIILYGTGEKVWDVTWNFNTKSRSGVQLLTTKWPGLCDLINEEYQRKLHNKNITNLEELMHDVECTVCYGSRLKTELLDVRFLGKNIHALTQLSILEFLRTLEDLKGKVDHVIYEICQVLLPNIRRSLKVMIELGLGHLTVSRAINTLSGGERQRVTLAGQLSTHLFGVTYVLDEPTIGLDDVQVQALTKALRIIVERGNTVVVVEHDQTFIKQADYLVEMGPGAGRLGGEVVFQGGMDQIQKATSTVTYQLIYGKPFTPRKMGLLKGTLFGVKNATANNLKGINVAFNSNRLIAVKGVSGSGKSSLIKNVLYRSWQSKMPIDCTSTFGLEQFDHVILIDQSPMHQNKLSTVASYTGILNQIKTIFSKTECAKKNGFKRADFSYLSKKGKCPSCSGIGRQKTSMDFMSDIWLTCPVCNGGRYDKILDECRIRRRSVAEVLLMTVNEAADFFEEEIILEKLTGLKKIGVGHLLLGQSTDVLSGGEAQRLKLSVNLLENKDDTVLYLLDEPSTGLHNLDLIRLISIFQSIIEAGGTVLCIEHNKSLIKAANQVITLGPGSGENGGEVIHISGS